MALSVVFEDLERSLYEIVRGVTVHYGYTPDITQYPDTAIGFSQYKADLKQIEEDKGFAVEVFNNSQPEDKGVIKTARIVITHGSTLIGDIGLPVQKESNDYGTHFGKVVGTTITNEYYYEVLLVARNLKEYRVIQGIVFEALPSRSWLSIYNTTEDQRFLNIMQGGYPDPQERDGQKGFIYQYSIPDVLITPYVEIGTVPVLKQINTELRLHLGL